jgi:Fe-S-cluster-containing hydrogenase component 2
MAVKIAKHLCPQNHRCPALQVCPVGALTQNGYEAPNINVEACIDCNACVQVCGRSALQAGERTLAATR